MSRRNRGRITVQHQPTGVERSMVRGMGLIHAIMGVVFVMLSLTMIRSSAGLIGLPFLLGGGFFAVNGIRMLVGKNGVSHRVAYDVEQDMTESIMGIMEDAPESGGSDLIEARLAKLQTLYDRRLITEEEYAAKRQEILDEL